MLFATVSEKMKLESGTCVSELLLFQDVRNAGAVKEMLINCQLDAAVFDAELVSVRLTLTNFTALTDDIPLDLRYFPNPDLTHFCAREMYDFNHSIQKCMYFY